MPASSHPRYLDWIPVQPTITTQPSGWTDSVSVSVTNRLDWPISRFWQSVGLVHLCLTQLLTLSPFQPKDRESVNLAGNSEAYLPDWLPEQTGKSVFGRITPAPLPSPTFNYLSPNGNDPLCTDHPPNLHCYCNNYYYVFMLLYLLN